MILLKKINESNEKSAICNSILRALPDWFEVESSIVDYSKQVKDMPFYIAECDTKAIGFVAIKIHTKYAAEICVMGVLKEYHGQGVGKKLVECCEKYCLDNKIEFLTAKTLDESRGCDEYKKTRLFYQSMGFKPLEVFPLLWDKDNPCLFLIKYIGLKD